MDMDEEPDAVLRLLESWYTLNRTVSRIAVQTQLFHRSYAGQNISEYIDEYTTTFFKLDRMGRDAATPETQKAAALLPLIHRAF